MVWPGWAAARRAVLARLEVGFAPAPAFGGLGPAGLDLLVGVAFEGAEATFAQGGVGVHRQTRGGRDGLRRLVGPQQVAGVDRLHALFGHGRGETFGLPAAGVVEGDVELALDAGVDVPGGLAVADRQDAGDFVHRCGGAARQSSRRLRV
jgi:hypothetical protein